MRFCLCFALFISPSLSLAQIDFVSQTFRSGVYSEKKEQPRSKSRGPASESTELSEAAKAKRYNPKQEIEKVLLAPIPENEPGFGSQFESLLAEEGHEVHRFYQAKLDADDPRLNKIEIQVLTGLTRHDSKSEFSPRESSASAGEVNLRSNVWFTPRLAVSGAVRFSVAGVLDSNSAPESEDPFRDETIEVGAKFRSAWGTSRTAPRMDVGFFYFDHVHGVSTDSTTRLRTRSSGLGLGVTGYLPSSERHAWVLGGSLSPSLSHEEDETQFAGRSGDHSGSRAMSVQVGGEWILARGSQILYGVDYRLEENRFSGPVSVLDPVTNETPSNVTVRASRMTFSLGYRWGR